MLLLRTFILNINTKMHVEHIILTCNIRIIIRVGQINVQNSSRNIIICLHILYI